LFANIAFLGTIDYMEALLIQERIHFLRVNKQIEDTLLLSEHPHVITIGRRGKMENILTPLDVLEKMNIKVYEVTRGGDVTYHGPGQLVGYPIFDLNEHGKDIKAFISKLEKVFINYLYEKYQINAHGENDKYTGIWVLDEKITAIGIAIKKWVSFHGFAFNVNTHLEYFNHIIPCGIKDRGVTSLKKILGSEIDLKTTAFELSEYICKFYNLKPKYISKDELLKYINLP